MQNPLGLATSSSKLSQARAARKTRKSSGTPGLCQHFTQVRALTFPTAREGELCPLFQMGKTEA